MVRQSDALGRWGEDIAAAHLQTLGMEVLDRGWRPAGIGLRGELDLVARDGRALVFVEVKTRSSGAFGVLEAVTPVKQRRLRRLALAWLMAHQQGAPELRFDVVGVRRDRPGLDGVVHVPAAF